MFYYELEFLNFILISDRHLLLMNLYNLTFNMIFLIKVY